ncbi:hypothetical protein H4R21_006433, partial [Coemansia helicoidea]
MAEASDSDPADAGKTSGGGKSEAAAAVAAAAAAKKQPTKCQACTSCRQKKVRCDGGKPVCAACLRTGTECLYVPSRRRGRPARANRSYERPYVNPLPILPRQPRLASGSSDKPPAPNRVLPTLPHLQPSQAGQGTLPPPPPTAPPLVGPLPPISPLQPQSARPRPYSERHQQQLARQADSIHQRLHGGQQHQQGIAPLGGLLTAALFPGSPHSTSEDDGGQSGHRSLGSESPLPPNARPPPFLVPAGERGGHQNMAQATPLVIP